MTLTKASQLAESKDTYIKDVYSFLAKAGTNSTIAGDEGLQLTASQVEELTGISHEHVKARYIEHFGRIETPDEARTSVLMRIAGDTLTNTKNGVGTLLDPAVYTHSNIPIVMGPYEGSSVYAPGGLPATIIDKKFRGMVIQGATFKAYDDQEKFWDADKVQKLEDAAFTTGFNDAILDAVCDAGVYG